MAVINKHGLARAIPESVKRAVRRACGFGCVECGVGIYHYDHIEPEFHDAQVHDPEKIALLCPLHHEYKSKARLGKAYIAAKRKEPWCVQNGYNHQILHSVNEAGGVAVNFGPVISVECSRILRINGTPILWLASPEEAGAPARLNASFGAACRVVDNEVVIDSANWDVSVVGPEITIRQAARNIVLRMRAASGESVRVERLHVWSDGLVADFDQQQLDTRLPR
jgi:hypothetical protein